MNVIGTQSQIFRMWHLRRRQGRYNGAYYYAREIEEIIIPKIESNLTIVTSGATLLKPHQIHQFSVIVCHDNRDTLLTYSRFFKKNILWICSKESTVKILQSSGEKAVYIPLSIDTQYVKKFKLKNDKRTKEIAFIGNKWGFKSDYLKSLPEEIEQISDLPREELLMEMAKYKRVIAEGRTMAEAQILGCKVELPKYNNLEAVFVKPLDNREAISLWKDVIENYTKYSEENALKPKRRY